MGWFKFFSYLFFIFTDKKIKTENLNPTYFETTSPFHQQNKVINMTKPYSLKNKTLKNRIQTLLIPKHHPTLIKIDLVILKTKILILIRFF